MRLTCSCHARAAGRANPPPRRRLLQLAAGACIGALTGLAGCDGRSGSAVSLAPVEIDRGTACELDGMLLADYPGPKAQLHVAGRAKPMFYCDTVELFNTLLAGEQAVSVTAVYVQDMGKADWANPQGHWIDARQALFVVGSRRHGSMGPTIASFSAQEDAARFAAEYGGTVRRFGEITLKMVDLSGGAKHDHRM